MILMTSFRFSTLLFLALTIAPFARGQEVQSAPGHFDYYLMNLSWAPEFCHNVEVLPMNERTANKRADSADECGTPRGFVLHGLWPQNFNGTWPATCSTRPGPETYAPYLGDTPSLTLLQHEWAKHGTCTTLDPDAFFATADDRFHDLKIPASLANVTHPITLAPDDLLGQFQAANPGYPAGSILLSCGHNYLTAVEACYSKDTLKPIACQGVKTCGATSIKVAPERASDSLQHGRHGSNLPPRQY